ncbi:MAG: EamA/RhaT family transporter, partial [Candidatus Rifleibacteriota bacterium]
VVVLSEKLGGLQIFGMALILVTVTALSVYTKAQSVPCDTIPRKQ